MIKKLLLFTAVAFSGVAFAQNLDLQTSSSVSIDGGTQYYFDTPLNLATNIKQYVANSSGSAIEFNCTVRKIANPTGSDLQVCFGSPPVRGEVRLA